MGELGRDTIPRSIQLIAGRTAQEYNQRKKRKGTFWEDRYHATAIENGEPLLFIAMGSGDFVDKIKSLMGANTIGRKSLNVGELYQLRETAVSYNSFFETEKDKIAPENSFF